MDLGQPPLRSGDRTIQKISSGAIGWADEVDSDTRTSGHVRKLIGNTSKSVVPFYLLDISLLLYVRIRHLEGITTQRTLIPCIPVSPHPPHPAMATLNEQLAILVEKYTACDVCPA